MTTCQVCTTTERPVYATCGEVCVDVMTAPETLRAAAAKLREDVLAQAEPGGPHWTDLWLPPDLAEPLAAWLEREADSAETHIPIWRGDDDARSGYAVLEERTMRSPEEVQDTILYHYGHALDVADVILGGES